MIRRALGGRPGGALLGAAAAAPSTRLGSSAAAPFSSLSSLVVKPAGKAKAAASGKGQGQQGRGIHTWYSISTSGVTRVRSA